MILTPSQIWEPTDKTLNIEDNLIFIKTQGYKTILITTLRKYFLEVSCIRVVVSLGFLECTWIYIRAKLFQLYLTL